MRTRGFEVVNESSRKHPEAKITLPTRADRRSAGYDFHTPVDITIEPNQSTLVWTDIKAYMLEDEVLKLYVRSSIGTKLDVVMKNSTGIIDSSYYNNPSNDGNIGISLRNNSDKLVSLKAGERIAQGIFVKYLVADQDDVQQEERIGGFGSSGK